MVCKDILGPVGGIIALLGVIILPVTSGDTAPVSYTHLDVYKRQDLLRSVSHDIRTPLTSIIGATSTVLDNPALSQEEQRALLTDVRDDAQWLIRVVENLLSITRIGNDQAKISKEAEAVEEVLGEAAGKFRKRFPSVSVEVHVPDDVLMVPMDPILIVQVLSLIHI